MPYWGGGGGGGGACRLHSERHMQPFMGYHHINARR